MVRHERKSTLLGLDCLDSVAFCILLTRGWLALGEHRCQDWLLPKNGRVRKDQRNEPFHARNAACEHTLSQSPLVRENGKRIHAGWRSRADPISIPGLCGPSAGADGIGVDLGPIPRWSWAGKNNRFSGGPQEDVHCLACVDVGLRLNRSMNACGPSPPSVHGYALHSGEHGMP
jgi:hypothetical protein